jgi:hypothetical protein
MINVYKKFNGHGEVKENEILERWLLESSKDRSFEQL